MNLSQLLYDQGMFEVTSVHGADDDHAGRTDHAARSEPRPGSAHRRRIDGGRAAHFRAVDHSIQPLHLAVDRIGVVVVFVAASTVSDAVELILNAIAAVISLVLAAIATIFGTIFGLCTI